MPIDTSMYNTKPVDQVNPLTSLGNFANISNALQSNRLLRQQEQINNVGLQRQNVGLQKDQVDLALQHYDNMNRMLAPLTANPNLSQTDMMGTIADAVRQKLLTPDQAIAETSNWGPDTPENNANTVKQHMLRFQGAADQMKAMYGANTSVDAGPNMQIGVTASPMMGGGFTPSSTIQKGLNPESAAQRIPVYNPSTKQYGTVPLGSTVNGGGNNVGNSNNAPSNMNNNSSSGMPSEENIANGGKLIVGTGNNNAVSPPNMGSAGNSGNNAPAGFLPTAAPFGQEMAQETVAKGSANRLQNLYDSIGTSQNRIFQLQQALGGLQNATTGPGTEASNQIKSFLIAQSPDFLKKIGVTPDQAKVASYDEANKYLTQYASNLASNMGQGTDAKLATALSGNANTHISNMAAQNVVKATIGLERMQQAQESAFRASGKSPDEFNGWSADWNRQVDPRVFIAPLMGINDRANLIKGMSPGELNKFKAQYQQAGQAGFLGD